MWGEIATSLATKFFGDSGGSAVNFATSAYDFFKKEKEAKKAQSAYSAALAQNQQLAALNAEIAERRANFELALRQSLLSQTGELGSALRSTREAMGPNTLIDQGRINQDYRTYKSSMMNDYYDTLKFIDSQSRASQIDRLGGAGSISDENSRINALVKRFQPELQKIDDAAYDASINRNTSQANLINQNRNYILGEVDRTISPQINAETALLSSALGAAPYTQTAAANLELAGATADKWKRTAADEEAAMQTYLRDWLSGISPQQRQTMDKNEADKRQFLQNYLSQSKA